MTFWKKKTSVVFYESTRTKEPHMKLHDTAYTHMLD